MSAHHHHHDGHRHHGHDGAGRRHHHHAPLHAGAFGRAFAIGIALNTGFVAIEAVFGLIGNSMALLADAGHNLSDVLGLVVAWVGAVLSQRPPSARFTYGLRGSSILAGLFNAIVLLLAMGGLAWEALQRLAQPRPVAEAVMIAVAAAGILVNGFTARLFAAGAKGDINIRGAYLHMAADAAVSAGVVAAGLAMWASGWLWLDPLLSLLIVGVVVWSTWDLLADSMRLSLNAVPPGIDPAAVRRFLAEQPGVSRLHDLHIWPLGTTETALTVHLVMPVGHPGDAFLMQVARELAARFGVGHVTVQIETDPATACVLEPDDVV